MVAARLNCFTSQFFKGLFDIDVVLGTGFKIHEVFVASPFGRHILWYASSRLVVDLVAEHEDGELGFRESELIEEVVEPVIEMSKTVHVCHVVDDDAAFGAAEKGRTHAVEAFLTGSILWEREIC